MNVRSIVLILALFSLISTTTGGYLYYHSAQKSAIKETERELVETTNELKDDIDRLISVNQNEVRTMASFERLQKAILNQDNASIAQADRVLDHFAGGLVYDVCYLMDGSGKTIASSNRNSKDSFVGHNYAFRPYFVDAIKGKPGLYLAVGVTSNSRGIYFSYPVYLPEGGLPIGVVVAKASTRDMDRALSHGGMGVSFLVHRGGIIFTSSAENLTLKLLRRASPEELSKIAETRQFGKGPWNWSGLEENAGNHVVDSSGEAYLMEEIGIGDLPGWRIVYLSSIRAINEKIVYRFVAKTGYVALFLCLFFGGAVIVLYVMAQRDITERKRAEDALRESEERYRTIADFNYDWEYWVTPEGNFLYMSPSCERITGYLAKEFIDDPELMNRIIHPDDLTEMLDHYHSVRKVNHQTMGHRDFRIIRRDGETRWIAHVCQPVYDKAGQPLGRRGSNRDITDRKRLEQEKEKLISDLQEALSEVKQLSRILPICASCKKIRDDEGYWTEVERYIGDHSETEFSHSICPDCMRKLYPEYADEVLSRLEKDENK